MQRSILITQHHRPLGVQKSNDRLCESLSGTFDWVEFLRLSVTLECHGSRFGRDASLILAVLVPGVQLKSIDVLRDHGTMLCRECHDMLRVTGSKRPDSSSRGIVSLGKRTVGDGE